MDAFIDLLSRYARTWATLGEHVRAGEREAAIVAAREVLEIASQLSGAGTSLYSRGVSLPDTLTPYEGWYGETAQELLCPDGLMVQGSWVAWPFSPQDIGLSQEGE